MIELPQPPANLTDWLILLGLIGAAIETARRRLVNPILKEMVVHAQEHAEAREMRALVLRQLAPNGHEYELPEDLRDKPIRDLVAKGIIIGRRTESAVKEHDAYSRGIVVQLNTDREARGLPPLPEAPRQGGTQ